MSIYPKEWDLNVDSDMFKILKTDMNMILRKTLHNMETKGSHTAELTVKLKISLDKEKRQGHHREVIIPKFEHKVSSVLQIKSELTGSMGGDYELIYDVDRSEWIMREIVDPQQNLFDHGYEHSYPGEDGGIGDAGADDTLELPGGEILQLTDKGNGEYELEESGEADEDDEYEYDEPDDEGAEDEQN